MSDLQSAISRSLHNSKTQYYKFRLRCFDGEEDELFVEVESTSHKGLGPSLVAVPRHVVLGVIEAVDSDVTTHVTVMFHDNVVRLTVTPEMHEMDEEELQGKIAQGLRIS